MPQQLSEIVQRQLQDAEAMLYVDVEAAAVRAEEALRQVGDRSDLVALALRAQIVLLVVDGHAGRSLRAMERGLGLVHEARKLNDPAAEARLWNVVGAASDQLELPERAVGCFERAVRLADQAADSVTAAKALTNLGVARSRMGRDVEALEHFRDALARTRQDGSQASTAHLHLDRAISLRNLGRLDEADDALQTARTQAQTAGHRRTYPYLAVQEGLLADARGDLAEGLRLLSQAISMASANDQAAALAAACLASAQLLRRRGEPADLQQASRLAERGLVAARAMDTQEWRIRLHHELSAIHTEAGQHKRALYHLRRALELEQGRARRRREREVAILRIEHEVDLLQQEQAALVEERRALAEANRELEFLSREKSEFMAIANHDLRSPLALVRLLGDELLHGHGLDERPPGEVGKLLVDACDRMLAVIDKLLVSEQLERTNHHVELAPVDARPIAERSLAAHAHSAKAKDIELSLVGAEHLRLRADADELVQILDNLVSNAIKFSPTGRPVVIELDALGTISVLDRGPGLTSEDLQRAFHKFSRLSARPTGDETSTGLGLYIVRRMVEDMGGQVEAAAREDGGARFTVTLPTAGSNAGAPSSPPPPAGSPSS